MITLGQVIVVRQCVECRVWIRRNGNVKIQEPGQKIKIFSNGNRGNTQKSQNKVND